MNKKVLILQFRDDVTKDEELALLIKKSGLRDADVISYNTILDEIPQNPNELLEDISCVVTGGSGQYDVTKNPEPIILSTNKTRIQPYEGIVISKKGRGVSKTFTVRKIGADNVGVERIFPLFSPNITQLDVVKRGKVRRAKLYYLRQKKGRAASRVKELKPQE